MSGTLTESTDIDAWCIAMPAYRELVSLALKTSRARKKNFIARLAYFSDLVTLYAYWIEEIAKANDKHVKEAISAIRPLDFDFLSDSFKTKHEIPSIIKKHDSEVCLKIPVLVREAIAPIFVSVQCMYDVEDIAQDPYMLGYIYGTADCHVAAFSGKKQRQYSNCLKDALIFDGIYQVFKFYGSSLNVRAKIEGLHKLNNQEFLEGINKAAISILMLTGNRNFDSHSEVIAARKALEKRLAEAAPASHPRIFFEYLSKIYLTDYVFAKKHPEKFKAVLEQRQGG